MLKKTLLATVAAVAVASPVMAADKPDIILEMEDKGFSFVKSFDTEAKDITGYVMQAGAGEHLITYVSEGAPGHMFVGSMVNAKGQNLTPLHDELHVPKPDYTEMLKELQDAKTIQGGTEGKRKMYVFLEPNCGFCKLIYKAMADYDLSNVEVHYVPVAFMAGEKSVKQAASLLQAKDPLAALHAHEMKSPAEMVEPTEATRQALEQNTQLMNKYGFGGTPAVVYEAEDGSALAEPGMPMLRKLAKILGEDYKKPSDKSLARFDR